MRLRESITSKLPSASLTPLQLKSLLALIMVLGAAAPLAAQKDFPELSGLQDVVAPGPSELSITSQFWTEVGGDRGALQVTVQIPPGAHIYSLTQKPGGPQRTQVVVDSSPEFELLGSFQPDKAPHIKPSELFPVPEELHEGQVTWSAPIRIREGTDVKQLAISGHIKGQVCRATSCMPLDNATFSARFGGESEGLFVDSAPAKASTYSNATSVVDWGLLLRNAGFGILGGMILNLMPCVLPVIGLKIMSFIEQSHGSRARAFQLNIIYMLGILSVFLVLASLAAGANLGWGEQFTNLTFKITMIAIVFAMALSFLGVWEIPIPGFVGSGKSVELTAQEGVAGAFFKGVFATILATPCSGPFLGPVFGYTLTQPPFVTYVIMLSVGFGMALPYLVIGLFPALAQWIPRPGAWMDTFKQLMGFVLLGTVVYLFTTLGNTDYFVPTLSLLFGIWFGCWLIGRTPITATTDRKLISWIGGIATAVVIGYVSMTWLVPHVRHIEWQPYSQTSLASAQADGKTVLVDFTAKWCPTCIVNLATAIDTEEVGSLVEELGVVPLIADWTDRSDEIKEKLAELGSISIPLLAIYPADDPDNPIVLRDSLSKQQVLDALQSAGPSTGVQVSSRSSSVSRPKSR